MTTSVSNVPTTELHCEDLNHSINLTGELYKELIKLFNRMPECRNKDRAAECIVAIKDISENLCFIHTTLD
jgi:hypothetical protein